MLVDHAFRTVKALQISPTADRYAAFGFTVNGLLTAVCVSIFVSAFGI